MRLLRTWSPFELGFPRFNRFERLFENFTSPEDNFNMPLLNVGEAEHGFIVTTELPGIDQKSIDIKVTGKTISIQGDLKGTEENKHYYINERFTEEKGSERKFSRQITLPVPLDGSNIKASYVDGILKVTIPKAEEAKPKSISVNID
ncbi:MAG: Hsp20/alpha crystallin family protein [Candidatus Coatesbacteria bacterium]|nr:Hsp20/alpha crystallin family protein [Candidatus Coatesbacteria bacterium]